MRLFLNVFVVSLVKGKQKGKGKKKGRRKGREEKEKEEGKEDGKGREREGEGKGKGKERERRNADGNEIVCSKQALLIKCPDVCAIEEEQWLTMLYSSVISRCATQSSQIALERDYPSSGVVRK